MEFTKLHLAGHEIAEVTDKQALIGTVQDALGLLANCHYQGINKIIIRETNLPPAFFDLKTGMAGEILQKFSNYRGTLAIVGDFSTYNSNSLRAFMIESNRMKRIHFVNSREKAIEVLTERV